MQDLPSYSIIFAAVGVLAAVIYYGYDMRNQARLRRADLFMRFFQHLDTKEFQEADLLIRTTDFTDYNDFEKKYGPFSARKPIHHAIHLVVGYFEAIGMMLYNKLIDEKLVWDIFTIPVRWEKVQPIVVQLRKEFNDPRLYEWFEYLYNWYQRHTQHPGARNTPIYQLTAQSQG